MSLWTVAGRRKLHPLHEPLFVLGPPGGFLGFADLDPRLLIRLREGLETRGQLRELIPTLFQLPADLIQVGPERHHHAFEPLRRHAGRVFQ